MDVDEVLQEAWQETFVADLDESISTYCADGMDAFEACLCQSISADQELVAHIHQGTQRLHQDLVRQVDASLGLFAQLCKSTIFAVPASALPPLAALPSLPEASTSQSEAELDEKLSSVRRQLAQVERDTRQVEDSIRRADAQLATCSGDAPAYLSLARTASANREGVVADVAAVADAAQRLRPLLAHAQRLRAARDPMTDAGNTLAVRGRGGSQLVKDTGALEVVQGALQALAGSPAT